MAIAPDDAAALAACRCFAGFHPVQRERLLASARPRASGARIVLCRPGDPCPGVYVVVAGAVRVTRTAPTGKELLLRVVSAPGSFLEVAVLAGLACPAQAETTGPARLLLVPADALRAALAESPAHAAQLLGEIAGRIPRLVDRLDDIALHPALARLARHLLRAPMDACWDDANGSWRDVAARLDMTPETVSRALRRLGELGAVQSVAGGGVRIADSAALARAAESA